MSDLIQVQPQIQPQPEPQKTEVPQVVPGSPEYNAQMIAKADAAKTVAATEGRPQWLPENFKSPEDLAKSYAEAQAEITRLKQGTAKPDATKEPAEGGDKPQEPANADDTFKKFSDEFYTSGKLSDTSYGELQKMGIPKAYVDEYVRNAIVAQESATNDLMKDFGGMSKWNEVSQWAARSYSPEDVLALNKVFDSGEPATIKQVLRGIYAQYDSVNPASTAPSLLSGDRSGSGYVNAYASKAEMVRDMSDPKYAKDPAFRKMVSDKISKSNI